MRLCVNSLSTICLDKDSSQPTVACCCLVTVRCPQFQPKKESSILYMHCMRCLRSSWRLMNSSRHALNQAASSQAVIGLTTRGLAGSSHLPPIRKHKRHVTRLEQAAAIGLQAMQQQAQQASAAAGTGSAAGPVMPPAVQQLLPQQQPQRKRVGESCPLYLVMQQP